MVDSTRTNSFCRFIYWYWFDWFIVRSFLRSCNSVTTVFGSLHQWVKLGYSGYPMPWSHSSQIGRNQCHLLEALANQDQASAINSVYSLMFWHRTFGVIVYIYVVQISFFIIYSFPFNHGDWWFILRLPQKGSALSMDIATYLQWNSQFKKNGPSQPRDTKPLCRHFITPMRNMIHACTYDTFARVNSLLKNQSHSKLFKATMKPFYFESKPSEINTKQKLFSTKKTSD